MTTTARTTAAEILAAVRAANDDATGATTLARAISIGRDALDEMRIGTDDDAIRTVGGAVEILTAAFHRAL